MTLIDGVPSRARKEFGIWNKDWAHREWLHAQIKELVKIKIGAGMWFMLHDLAEEGYPPEDYLVLEYWEVSAAPETGAPALALVLVDPACPAIWILMRV
jgi:hypothetical protein